MTSKSNISLPATDMRNTASTAQAKTKTPQLASIAGALFWVCRNGGARSYLALGAAPATPAGPDQAKRTCTQASCQGQDRRDDDRWIPGVPLRIGRVRAADIAGSWLGWRSGPYGILRRTIVRGRIQVMALDLPAHRKSSGKTASVKHFERILAHFDKTYGPFPRGYRAFVGRCRGDLFHVTRLSMRTSRIPRTGQQVCQRMEVCAADNKSAAKGDGPSHPAFRKMARDYF